MAAELKPARVRPAIRRIAIWVAPVLLFIAAWQVWDAIEARRVERALAPILGPPLPAKVRAAGSDEGAGRYYAAASLLAVSLTPRERIQSALGAPIVDAATSIREALARGGTPTKDALDAAGRQIDEGGSVFVLLSRASTLPFDGFSPGTDFNYRFSGLVTINRLAGLQAMNLAMNGQGDSAARALIDRLRSLRAFDEQRSIDLMTRAWQIQEIATDLGILVARGHLADERLAELDRALSETYASDAVERAIRGDALWFHQELRSFWEGKYRVIGPLLRPLLRHHAVMRLQTTSDALAAARLPWPDRISAMNRIPEPRTIVPEVFGYIAASRPVVIVRDETIRIAEAIAATRCARLVVAIERYRLARGMLPQALTDLSPRNEESLDPFTGKPLLYSQTGAGYVVYSVGRNVKDEGGKLVADLPRGRLPGTLPAPDVGVRVVFTAVPYGRPASDPTTPRPPRTP
jgi:hypothetical protein